MAEISTNADPGATGWAIRDAIVRLRVYGSDQSYDLAGATSWVLGASSDCSIQLDDKTGRVSRRHATIEQQGDALVISDLGSTNGIRQDGEDRKSFPLAPGVEIELGGVKVIAESRRSIELHELLRRFIGWSTLRLSEVDRALRAVREMANLRASLTLRGDGSLIGIARHLHAIVLGPERPMIVREPNESGMTALGRAIDGLLYLDAEKLPVDVQHVIVSLRLPDTRVRLVIGANTAEAAAEVGVLIPLVATVWIPPLVERQDEMDRLLETYGRDAVAKVGANDIGLRPHDLKWIRDSGIKTLEEAEDVMLRMVAMRNWGVTSGAERLGITHGALSRWARRRKIPT